MAEREGFEPPIPVKVCLISSQVHSTGLCHLSLYRSISRVGFGVEMRRVRETAVAMCFGIVKLLAQLIDGARWAKCGPDAS
jgi:hypothetical protein